MKNKKLRILPLLLVASAVSIPTIGSVITNNIDSQNNTVISDIKYSDPEPISDPTLTTSSTWKSAFPDRAFRGIMWKVYNPSGTYNDDIDGNTNLTQAQIDGETTGIENLKSLTLTNQGISSLAGIEHFTSLSNLYCGQNNLSFLDVTKNVNLVLLEVHTNKLQDIDVSTLARLVNFRADRNDFRFHLDFSNNTKLEQLRLYQNLQLPSIDITKCPELIRLMIHNTAFTTLDLTQNTKLSYIEIQTLKTASIDFSQNVNLTEIKARGNHLTTADFSNLPKLVNLDIHGTRYEGVLDLSGSPVLKTVDVSGAPITDILVNDAAKSVITNFLFYSTSVIDYDMSGFTSLVQLGVTTSVNLETIASLSLIVISGSRPSEVGHAVYVYPGSGALSWNNGYYILDPHEASVYGIGLFAPDPSGMLQLHGSTSVAVKDGGVLDREGNFVIGATLADIDFTEGTIQVPVPGEIVTPDGIIKTEKEAIIDSEGKIITKGRITIDEIGIEDYIVTPNKNGTKTIDSGESPLIVDPITGEISIEGPAIITIQNKDVIITTGETTFDREGYVVSTIDPYVIVKEIDADKIGKDPSGNTTVPNDSELVLGSGVTFTLVDGGTIDDKSVIIGVKESIQLANGDVSVFPEGGVINPDGSITSNGYVITIDRDDVPYIGHNKDGSITIPGGNVILTAPNGNDYGIPNGGIILTDDTIRLSNEGCVVLPNGNEIVFPNGGVFDPATGNSTHNPGKPVILPNGDAIISNEVIVVDENGDIVLPSNGNFVVVDKDNVDDIATDRNGTVVPGGSAVLSETGKNYVLPNGGTLLTDDTVKLENEGSVILPGGELVFPNGGIFDPSTGNSTINPGKPIVLPNGDVIITNEVIVIDENGEVVPPSNGNYIVVPSDEADDIKDDGKGNAVAPGGSVIITPTDDEFELPNGGTLLDDGTVKLDDNGSVVLPNGETIDFPHGGIFDPSTGLATQNADPDAGNNVDGTAAIVSISIILAIATIAVIGFTIVVINKSKKD